jgi:HSP20 family protein
MKTESFIKVAEHDVVRTFYGCFSDMDHLKEESPVHTKSDFRVAMNVAETCNEYLLELALPGYHKNDLDLEIQDDILIITATGFTGIPRHREVLKYAKKEFGMEAFTRTFLLPEDAVGGVAFFEAGILIVHLIKGEPKKWSSGATCCVEKISIQ